MAQETEEKVRAPERRNSLQTHPFRLEQDNYYCKHGRSRYLGCEIALAEFSFVDGVRKIYHALINPGEIHVSYAFLTTKRATETHLIPLPQDGFGSESDHLEILSIILFLMEEDGDETELPPLHATGEYRRCWKRFVATAYKPWSVHECRKTHVSRILSLSLSKLFHELQNASMGAPSAVILPPIFLSEHELINDALKFTEGISCDFLEHADAMRHCSLSHMQRWSFLIVEQCCGLLKIDDSREALCFRQPSCQRNDGCIPGLEDSMLESKLCPS
jgi:hypothetical protein